MIIQIGQMWVNHAEENNRIRKFKLNMSPFQMQKEAN